MVPAGPGGWRPVGSDIREAGLGGLGGRNALFVGRPGWPGGERRSGRLLAWGLGGLGKVCNA